MGKERISDLESIENRLTRLENLIAQRNAQMTIRQRIRRFHERFGVVVNDSYTEIDIATCELRAKLLLEECIEYVVKGLGCDVLINDGPRMSADDKVFEVSHREGVPLNPIEIADGLADINVVLHGSAHSHGINLDRATAIVDDSNMSKLDDDGKAIINGVTPGYRGGDRPDGPSEIGFDPSKPIGKILKSENFYPPEAGLSQLLAEVGQNKE